MARFRLADWKSWLRTARPVDRQAVLDRRHVYILPTRQGVLYFCVLCAMLLGSINYSLSMGYALTFLLAGLGLVSMLHTWRNLAGLVLQAGRSAPVFAGEAARLGLAATELQGRARYAIRIATADGDASYIDVVPEGHSELALPLTTTRRGWLVPGRLTVSTEFPLGLFHAWGYVALEQAYLVYPRPAPPGRPLPLSDAGVLTGNTLLQPGDEDFAGLRPYQAGDSMRRIDWKASAREQELLAKQFEGGGSARLWLDWEAAGGGDIESRIAQLTRWVIDSEAAVLPYGLRLPGRELRPAVGEAHYHACLEALALFGMPS